MKRKRHERAETRNVEEWLRKLSVDNIFLSDLGIPSVLLQLIKSYLLFDLPLGYILRVESRICHPRRHSFWHLRSRYVEVSGPLVVHYGSLSYSTVQRERKRTKDDEKNLWISRTNRSVYNRAYHTRKKNPHGVWPACNFIPVNLVDGIFRPHPHERNFFTAYFFEMEKNEMKFNSKA